MPVFALAPIPMYAVSTTVPTLTVPHLRIPFALDVTGGAAVVEQDSLGEITQCVTQLLGTVIGSRDVVPTYGIPDPTFSGPSQSEITNAIAAWEPRAAVSVTVTTPPGSPAVVTVIVEQATS